MHLHVFAKATVFDIERYLAAVLHVRDDHLSFRPCQPSLDLRVVSPRLDTHPAALS